MLLIWWNVPWELDTALSCVAFMATWLYQLHAVLEYLSGTQRGPSAVAPNVPETAWSVDNGVINRKYTQPSEKTKEENSD